MTWIVDRPPTDDDTTEEAGRAVEVTYDNGLVGWEHYEDLGGWKHEAGFGVVAWRKIRPAFPIRTVGAE